MKKIFFIPFLFISFILSASPIGADKAREIAVRFFEQNHTKSSVKVGVDLVWFGDEVEDRQLTKASVGDSDKALIYIFNRSDSKAFVVIAGDDRVKPIIAFSDNNSFDISNMAEGTRAILDAWCRQIAAARYGNGNQVYNAVPNSVGEVQYLYSTALWGQGEPFNGEAPLQNAERCVTGCVATAMSILAYYHKWPVEGTGTTPEYSYEKYGVQYNIPSNSLGRTYDYSNMLSDYSDGYTSVQGNAVAALMKDMGTAVKMMYGVSESGAMDLNVPIALTTFFGYSKEMVMASHTSYPENEWVLLLQDNLKNYGPMYFSGQSISGGHAFVLDGYTDADYFHINFGWNGSNNGYYLLPKSPFYEDQQGLLRAIPDKTNSSSYADYLVLIADQDRELVGIKSNAVMHSVGKPFNITIGGVQNNGLANFTGKIALVMCDESGVVKESWVLIDRSANALMPYYYTWAKNKSITISEPINIGYRLRVCYRGSDSQPWQWARKIVEEAIDELVIAASPEDVAKSLELIYNKDTKALSFKSSLSLHYELLSSSSAQLAEGDVAAYTEHEISVSELPRGNYTLKFSCNGSPYILTVVL
jgi:hypothetical protein